MKRNISMISFFVLLAGLFIAGWATSTSPNTRKTQDAIKFDPKWDEKKK